MDADINAKMSSCNYVRDGNHYARNGNLSEEQHSAQLQLELRTLSTADAAWEELYWQFLDNARHRQFGFNLFGQLRAFVEVPFVEVPFVEVPYVEVAPRGPWHWLRLPPSVWRPRLRLPEAHQPATSSTCNRCILCFDDVATESESKISCGIACSRNHLIHRHCLDSLIVNHCETVLHTPSTPSHIDCPTCKAQHHPVQVQPYTEEQLKLGASQQALDLLASVAQADQALASLPEDEQITNGNTDCYLCPKCKFGPVAHAACADLTSHHAQGGVSNKCPKCGFFGSSISEWIQISAPRQPTIDLLPVNQEFRFHGGLEFRNPRQVPVVFRTPTAHLPRAPGRWMPDFLEAFDLESLRTLEMNLREQSMSRYDEWLLAPSYWDAVTGRLMQTAMQAAAGSNQRVAAIANGSETADSAAQFLSTLCLSDEGASEQSLVVTRHACLRVHSVQHERTASHAALAVVLRHAARSNKFQRGWAGLPDATDVGLMGLMIIGQNSVKKPLIHVLQAIAARGMRTLTIEYAARDVRVIGDDDKEAQAEKRHERQLGCCRVV